MLEKDTRERARKGRTAMAKPDEKAPQIDKFLGALRGKNRKETIEQNKCMTCDGDAIKFRDELSEREYAISGMCQECQDGIGEE